jgi:hypothetical protein
MEVPNSKLALSNDSAIASERQAAQRQLDLCHRYIVSGSLTVRELIWGDYNHGDLTVKGDASAAVFADTDEYHYDDYLSELLEGDEAASSDYCTLSRFRSNRIMSPFFVPDEATAICFVLRTERGRSSRAADYRLFLPE